MIAKRKIMEINVENLHHVAHGRFDCLIFYCVVFEKIIFVVGVF